MPRYGIDDIGHKAVSPTERLEAMPPRVAWRNPGVGETEAANPSPDDLRGVASSLSEDIGGQSREEWAGGRFGYELQETGLDDGRMKRHHALGAGRLQRAGLGGDLHTPDPGQLRDVLDPKLAYFGYTGARICSQ
jgi:hypothetical protein